MPTRRPPAPSQPKSAVAASSTSVKDTVGSPPSTDADTVALESFLHDVDTTSAVATLASATPSTPPAPPTVPNHTTGPTSHTNATMPSSAIAAGRAAAPPILCRSRHTRSRSGGGDAAAAAARAAQYQQNWSQVVLGATSGIMFVLVAWLSHALYCLIAPYYYGITNGILLSIVMHPQSRLRSSLYMGTAVARMQRQQRAWAARGRLAGVVGSWLSLRHFASFVLMQVTFFLGLNKISVAPNSFLLGCDRGDERGGSRSNSNATACTSTHSVRGEQITDRTAYLESETPRQASAKPGVEKAKEVVSAGESRASSPQAPGTQQGVSPTTRAARRRSRRNTEGNAANQTIRHSSSSGSSSSSEHSPHSAAASSPSHSQTLRFPTDPNALASSVILNASVVLTPVLPSPAVPPLAAGRRLVATARGRRVLRYLTLAFLLLLAHLLVGLPTFAVLHVGLGCLFAICVPFMPAESFVRSMGRLWRTAVILFLVVGLYTSFRHDCMMFPKLGLQLFNDAIGRNNSNGISAVKTGDGGWDLKFELHNGSTAQFHVPMIFARVGDGNSSSYFRSQAENDPQGDLASMIQGDHLIAKLSSFFTFVQENLRHSHTTTDSNKLCKEGAYDCGSSGTLVDSSVHGQPGVLTRLRDKLLGSYPSAKATAATMPSDRSEVSRLKDSASDVGFYFSILTGILAVVVSAFDTVYATLLFVFVFRYLVQREHTVLYYGIAKLLRVIQPEVGDHHARNIEHDITVSFVTLLQSFWHLTWFHFCVTFCAFALWGMATPFLLGLISVLAALFPLVPKWLSPCSIAAVYAIAQLVRLTSAPEEGNSPFFYLADNTTWTTALIFGKPYLFHYARAATFVVATLLEVRDEWLLCVSRGVRGGFVVGAVATGDGSREQLEPFVIGTAIVLGFVAYGIRGIVLGPLTVIVARVLYDNWDIVLSSRDLMEPPSPLPTSLVQEEGGREN